MSRRIVWIAAPLSMLLASCNDKQAAQAPAPPPPTVGVQAAANKGVSRAYSFVGRIKAIESVALRARVEGFIEKILFTEGQDVKAGDLLYSIEKTQYDAQLAQAQANVESAKAQQVNAQLTFNRSTELMRTQNVSQATLDTNKANLDVAKAAVLQQEASQKLADENLGYTDIKAPVEGRIGRTTYTLGNLVGPTSDPLATIVSQDPIYVQFQVSVRQLEEIRTARQQEDGRLIKIDIVVRQPNGKDYPQPGVWNYTDPQVDQSTDTLTMRATIPNPKRQLIDGQFVTVGIRERQEQQRLVVPQAAVQVDQAGSYVLIVDKDSKVAQVRVKTGPTQESDIVIEDGLKENDKVIVDGLQKVRPGQTVTANAQPPSKG